MLLQTEYLQLLVCRFVPFHGKEEMLQFCCFHGAKIDLDFIFSSFLTYSAGIPGTSHMKYQNTNSV